MRYAVLCLKDDIILYDTITIISTVDTWTLDTQPKFFIVLTKLSQGAYLKQFCVPYVNPQLSLDKTQSIADHQLTLAHLLQQQQ